jgi:KaiC/GvpD/RAD55 family RecA-like ATPase
MSGDGAPAVVPVRSRVSTGYPRLDEALHGGLLEGSAILLTARAGDEVPILVGNFLKASNDMGLLVCRSLSAAGEISQFGSNVKFLISSERPIPSSQNVLVGKGIENLTEMNFQISETVNSVQPKRFVLETLSDILLRHKALQTRKWLSEVLEKLRFKRISTLAVLDPYMHASEEAEAVVNLFDGNLELVEKGVSGTIGKFLRINWMHGIDNYERELLPVELPARLQAEAVPLEPSGDLQDLGKKLDTIMNRLGLIERVLADSLQHPELASTISGLRAGVLLVKEPISALERLSAAEKYIHRRSVEKDEISRIIIQTLALNGPRNTSQIERAVREARGHASRRIIRSRIENLMAEGIVGSGKGRGTVYELTD